ncbi:MAG TPA: hypothetical protein GXX51_05465 [Firmicutes bacterium]|nr:hypothetical protein [Bacillota bacterium]
MFSGSFETFATGMTGTTGVGLSLRALSAALLAGVAIKLVDDYIDREVDEISGRYSLAAVLEGALIPYALLCAALACALDSPLASSLIIGSYIVGMLHDLDEVFPSGFSARLESLLAGALGVIILGWKAILSSVILMLGVQLVDDIVDYLRGGITAGRNYARAFGCVESGAAALACIILGLILNSSMTIVVLVAFLVLVAGERVLERVLVARSKGKGWAIRDS